MNCSQILCYLAVHKQNLLVFNVFMANNWLGLNENTFWSALYTPNLGSYIHKCFLCAVWHGSIRGERSTVEPSHYESNLKTVYMYIYSFSVGGLLLLYSQLHLKQRWCLLHKQVVGSWYPTTGFRYRWNTVVCKYGVQLAPIIQCALCYIQSAMSTTEMCNVCLEMCNLGIEMFNVDIAVCKLDTVIWNMDFVMFVMSTWTL